MVKNSCKMTSHSDFIVTDSTQANTTGETDCLFYQPKVELSSDELSLSVQADHNYSRPLIKEEEFEAEDDLKVVEITEEVDVSMHFGENGSAYFQDVNGVQWNLENPDPYRLDDLSWKPSEEDLNTESQNEYMNNVTLVKNCVNCKAPLTSGALCMKCNQPWVALTDIYKSKDFFRHTAITKEVKVGEASDPKHKKFYILRKSDVKQFVNKNMGKLSIVNQYDAANLNLGVFSNDGCGQMKRNDVATSNDSSNVSPDTSSRSVLKKVADTNNVVKQQFPIQRKEDNCKFNFIKKYMSVDVNYLNQNVPVKKEVEEQNEIEESSIQVNQNEVTAKKLVEDTNAKRSPGKRKCVLNHKILNKNTKFQNDAETEDEQVIIKSKPKKQPKKKYLCVACDTSFVKYDELQQHMKKHKSPFGCTKCDLKLLNETELISHSVVHNVILTRNLKCKVCGKEVKNLSMLRVHSYIHVKNKEFPCKHCEASFHGSSQLKNHMIKHGALPYTCNLCQRQFKRSGYLRRHYCPKRWNPV